uniref:Protein kinase domain-containing protein n=1 Tax=Gadus morhua TaxID=8049 RepID=A0A8C5AY50_GADMO
MILLLSGPMDKMDRTTFLYNVPPSLIEHLCKIIDSGDDQFGWRGLAARIVPSWLEVRRAERLEAAGRSPARELLWTWAQQNPTVADLVRVLEDMGHHWALQLFVQYADVSYLLHLSLSPLPAPCSTDPDPEGAERRALTYDDVVGGTKHFHHDLKIAAGSLSDTYKGTLGTETFVVKRFKTGNDPLWKERWDSFTRDTEVHHLFQHPNILNLLGCFLEEGNHCLVYPYLPNGSLHQRLHDLPAQPLSWQQRLSVIKGAAKGLHHLHTAQLQPLICGNITSSHVLLDHALGPQLSNVGLSRLRPPPPRQTTALSTQSIHGNLGYLPPEFIRHDGKPSCSLDVYSFGMVMMETITGRKVVEETPKRSLLRDVLSVERDDSGGSVDSCVRFLDREAGSWPYPTARSLLRLALDCTAARPRNRPCMDTVLRELSQLLPSHPPSEDGYHDDGSYVASGLGPDSAKPLPREFSQSELIFWSSCEDPPGRHETGGDLMAPAPGRLTEAGVGAVEVEVAVEVEGGVAAAAVDLYNSWPVQCSCQADSGELGCEDCRANGFTLEHSDTPPCDLSYNITLSRSLSYNITLSRSLSYNITL